MSQTTKVPNVEHVEKSVHQANKNFMDAGSDIISDIAEIGEDVIDLGAGVVGTSINATVDILSPVFRFGEDAVETGAEIVDDILDPIADLDGEVVDGIYEDSEEIKKKYPVIYWVLGLLLIFIMYQKFVQKKEFSEIFNFEFEF